MKRYHGKRAAEAEVKSEVKAAVTVDGRALDPRLDLHALSPDGFEWGYGGDGPGQLALALLAEHFGDDARALAAFPAFRDHVVAHIAGDEWDLDSAAIERALADIERTVPMTLAQLLAKVKGQSS